MSRDRAAKKVAELANLDLRELRNRWRDCYGTEPSNRISRDLLIQAIAFEIQARAIGGPTSRLKQQIRRHQKQIQKRGDIAEESAPSIRPGTRLVREWRGRVHEVTIGVDGYFWSGEHFGSLSEIARRITGTRWSGPRFFGVEEKTNEVAAND